MKQVRDVMTRNVITVKPDESILVAARLMLQDRISGVPVVDDNDTVVGVVTEGDFLRRGEIGTTRQRPKWLEFILGPGRLADEFVRSSGRKVAEIMTGDPYTIGEDASLESLVETMERRRIKRLPVVRGGRLVGIISRADLMHALANIANLAPQPAVGDTAIRERALDALAPHHWAFGVNVIVKDGIADLWGTITDERERQACIVAVEDVPGVKAVRDHLVWVEPMSGMAFPSVEDEAAEHAASA